MQSALDPTICIGHTRTDGLTRRSARISIARLRLDRIRDCLGGQTCQRRSRARPSSWRSSSATPRRSTRWTAIAAWAAGLGYEGVQIPTWDARLFDLEKAADSQDLLRRGRRASARDARRRDHRAVHAPAGPAGGRAPGLRRAVRRLRAAPRCGASRPRARTGPCEQLKLAAQGLDAPGPDGARHLLRRAGLALSLPLAAAAGRPGRGGLRRAGQALAADPRRLRRGRRRRLLRDASGRGPARRRHLRDVPRRGRRPPALLASSTTRRTSCCSSSTTSPSSTSTTSASRSSTSRTPSSARPAARASTAATSPGSNRAGRFRSLGDGQVDFGAHLLQAGAVRLRRLGGAGMGVLPQAPRGRRRRRRALHPRPHHPRHRAGLRRLRRRRHRPRQPSACWASDGRSEWPSIEGTDGRGGSRPHPPRHGRRRAGRLHRRRAPHRGAARRPVRAGGRRAVVGRRRRRRPRRPNWAWTRSAATAASPRWPRPRRRARRHRGGGHRHAQPPALRRRPRPSWRPASTSSATSR